MLGDELLFLRAFGLRQRMSAEMPMAQMLLSLDHVSCSFGERQLFLLPHLTIHEGDRIGLIGRNGPGKSTLMQLLTSPPLPHGLTLYSTLGSAPQFGSTDQDLAPQAIQAFRLTGRAN